MTTDEMVAGLRELAEAEAAFSADPCNEKARRVIDAEGWANDNASAIADELAMLAEEVKHLKPLAESTLEENERLSEQNERLKEAERYWNEARHIVPQPSTPRTWADDIVALHDLSGAKTKLEAGNARLRAEVEDMKGDLMHIYEYWNHNTEPECMKDALWEIIDTAHARLFPALDAKGGG